MLRKSLRILTLCSVLALASNAFCVSNSIEPTFKKSWGELNDISNEASPYLMDESREEKTFWDKVKLREPKYVRLIKQAQEILGISEITPLFDEIGNLSLDNKALYDEITALKRERITAPASSYNPLTRTVSDIDKQIASKNTKINSNQTSINSIKRTILNELDSHGIILSDQQLDSFVILAEGDDLMRLMTMAENMKRIQEIIERELRDDPNNVELAKIYTGMYMVALDAYARAHDTAIEHISEYRNNLESILSEAKNNYREAKRLMDQAGGSAHAEANLNLNERTLDVANSYDNLLERRKKNLDKIRSALGVQLAIARNTYKTLTNGSALIALVNQGSNEYTILINFEMPELKDIYEAGMLSVLADISDKIKAEK